MYVWFGHSVDVSGVKKFYVDKGIYSKEATVRDEATVCTVVSLYGYTRSCLEGVYRALPL